MLCSLLSGSSGSGGVAAGRWRLLGGSRNSSNFPPCLSRPDSCELAAGQPGLHFLPALAPSPVLPAAQYKAGLLQEVRLGLEALAAHGRLFQGQAQAVRDFIAEAFKLANRGEALEE